MRELRKKALTIDNDLLQKAIGDLSSLPQAIANGLPFTARMQYDLCELLIPETPEIADSAECANCGDFAFTRDERFGWTDHGQYWLCRPCERTRPVFTFERGFMERVR